MEIITLFIVAVFLVNTGSAGRSDPTPLPPKRLNKEEISVGKNENATRLTCVGDRPIVWTFKDYDGTTEYIGKGVAVSTEDYVQASSLTISVDEGYQGFYYCHYEGADIHDSSQSNSTYVYLFASQENFASISLITEYKIYKEGDNFFLDCRATRPNITVGITRNGEEIHNGPLEEPRRGYYIENVTGRKILGDEYICKIQTQHEKKFTIKVNRKLQPPWIDIENDTDVVGRDLEIDCRLLDREDLKDVKFTWTHPDQVDDDRVSKTISHGPDEHNDIYTSTLKVRNVTLEDSGNYECKVSMDNYPDTENYINIKIKDGSVSKAAIITTEKIIFFFNVLVVMIMQYSKL